MWLAGLPPYLFFRNKCIGKQPSLDRFPAATTLWRRSPSHAMRFIASRKRAGSPFIKQPTSVC
jgi:hypothetical protein